MAKGSGGTRGVNTSLKMANILHKYVKPSSDDYAFRNAYLNHKNDTESYENASLEYYTNYGYDEINKKLRNGTSLSDKEKAIIYFLDKKLKAVPKYDGLVYRGVALNNEQLKSYTVGNEVKFNSYSSASKKLSVAKNSTTNGGGDNEVIFRIHSNRGRDISSSAVHSEEQEVLFGRNQKFKVQKISKRKGYTYIDLV